LTPKPDKPPNQKPQGLHQWQPAAKQQPHHEGERSMAIR